LKSNISKLRTRRVGLAVLVAAVALPGAALAGQRVVSGDQSLQISGKLTPAKARAKRVTLSMNVNYQSTVPNQHIPYNPKLVELTLPAGTRLLTGNAPFCNEHKFGTTSGSDQGTACPTGSLVGTGTVSADARPTLAQPVPATLEIYNARYGCGCYDHPAGSKKGSPDLLFYIRTKLGVNDLLVFSVRPDGKLIALVPPPKVAGSKPLFSLQSLIFTIGATTKKPFITAPATCTGGKWRFGLTITNYDGPSISAHDTQACTAAKSKTGAKRPVHHHATSPSFTG
jgi:hypothetical protein